jgi:hypothetical protein
VADAGAVAVAVPVALAAAARVGVEIVVHSGGGDAATFAGAGVDEKWDFVSATSTNAAASSLYSVNIHDTYGE